MKCDICKREITYGKLSWEYNGWRYCQECRERESKKEVPISDADAIECIREVLNNRKSEIQCGQFDGSQIPAVEVVRSAKAQLVETLREMIGKRYHRDRLWEDD